MDKHDGQSDEAIQLSLIPVEVSSGAIKKRTLNSFEHDSNSKQEVEIKELFTPIKVEPLVDIELGKETCIDSSEGFTGPAKANDADIFSLTESVLSKESIKRLMKKKSLTEEFTKVGDSIKQDLKDFISKVEDLLDRKLVEYKQTLSLQSLEARPCYCYQKHAKVGGGKKGENLFLCDGVVSNPSITHKTVQTCPEDVAGGPQGGDVDGADSMPTEVELHCPNEEDNGEYVGSTETDSMSSKGDSNLPAVVYPEAPFGRVESVELYSYGDMENIYDLEDTDPSDPDMSCDGQESDTASLLLDDETEQKFLELSENHDLALFGQEHRASTPSLSDRSPWARHVRINSPIPRSMGGGVTFGSAHGETIFSCAQEVEAFEMAELIDLTSDSDRQNSFASELLFMETPEQDEFELSISDNLFWLSELLRESETVEERLQDMIDRCDFMLQTNRLLHTSESQTEADMGPPRPLLAAEFLSPALELPDPHPSWEINVEFEEGALINSLEEMSREQTGYQSYYVYETTQEPPPDGPGPDPGSETELTSLEVGFPLEKLSSLPSKVLDEAALHKYEQCVICMDKYKLGDELIDLPCAHEFHRACAIRWLEQKTTCPVCRFQLESEALMRPLEDHLEANNSSSDIMDNYSVYEGALSSLASDGLESDTNQDNSLLALCEQDSSCELLAIDLFFGPGPS